VDEEGMPRRVEQAQAFKRMLTPANGDLRRIGSARQENFSYS
jgi:adenylate kinase family enzyme